MLKRERGKKDSKKEEGLVSKESFCATCALFSLLAVLILFTRSLIFGEIGETIHIFLTGAFGYFAYPVVFGVLYLSVMGLIGKRLVKNRRLGTCIALTVVFAGLIVQTAMTYKWSLDGYIKQCFLGGVSFPNATACGVLGGLCILGVAKLTTKIGAIVFFSVVTAFMLCLCYLAAKKRPAEVKETKDEEGSKEETREESSVEERREEAMPEVKQRPGVSLATDRAPATEGFSPFGTPERSAPSADIPYGSREFLFGGTPAENYQKNLIFDPNARVNQKRGPEAEKWTSDGLSALPKTESSYTPSYSSAYESSMNADEPIRPAKIVSDYSGESSTPRYVAPEEPPVMPTPSYEEEKSYLDLPEETSSYDDRTPEPLEREETPLGRGEIEERDGRPEETIETEKEEEPYRRHEYMEYFSPSNPRVFGEDGDETRLGRDVEESEPTRGGYEESRDSCDTSEERGARDGLHLLDDADDDPYTLRSDYEETVERGRSVAETRGRDFEEEDTSVEEEPIRGRGMEEPITPPKAVEPTPPPAPKPVEPPKPRVIKPYKRVPLDDFDCRDIEPTANQEEVEYTKENILATLEEFKITGASIASVTFGPTVTRYNVTIPRNISPKKVVALDQSIAISLHSSGVNIYPNYEDGVVSIEVPNKERQFVQLGCMLSGDTFVNAKSSSLMFAMGKDVANRKVYGDITKMVHLLVAGSTNSGKSVFLGALIISLIYKYSPEELRLILIDPKKTEFVLYNDLPHLMINEIITDAGKAVQSLNWAVGEMNRRYGLFEQMSRAGTYVVNLDQYNDQLDKAERLPKIVIIIDELADLMLSAKKEMEDRIQSLTQRARAAGIHLIVATQRPSTDVITGVIKSNLPTRIAFSVATDVDSRVILDQTGAQKLLGKGDFLYTMPGINVPVRVQSAFISPEDSQKVVNFIKNNNEAYYDEEATAYINSRGGNGGTPSDPFDSGSGSGENVDPMYIEALRYVILSNSASISMIQRKCSAGYNRAGKIIEWMEDMGYISPFDGAKARKVLITKEEFESKYGPLEK